MKIHPTFKDIFREVWFLDFGPLPSKAQKLLLAGSKNLLGMPGIESESAMSKANGLLTVL